MKTSFLCVAMLMLASTLTAGQTYYSVIYNFGSGGATDGAGPNGGFAYTGGQLYGTTLYGGADCPTGCGTVFALETLHGINVYSIIYNFCTTGDPHTCIDGAFPEAGLIADKKGNLYGTTGAGGGFPCVKWYGTCGTVFQLTPSGQSWTETVIHSFNGQDGERPTGQLTIDAAGNLYGTTVGGGVYGAGVVFEISPGPEGWTEKTLHDFDPATGDGAEPYHSGVIFDGAGNLYGSTPTGGSGTCQFDEYFGCGIVFKLSPNPNGTWAENVIYQMRANLAFPESSLVFDKAGHLYGTSFGGNGCYPSCGGAFRLVSHQGTWTANALVFDSQNGSAPQSGLVLNDGAAYGSTLYGAEGFGYGNGVIFQIKGGIETVLHIFSGYPVDGANPSAGPVFLGANNLYGATASGGPFNAGTIFGLVLKTK